MRKVVFCVPGRDYPGDKTVIARVIDENGTEREFRFAADIRISRAASLVETLWYEEESARKRRKGIAL